MEVKPYVRLLDEGHRVVGDYQVGLQTGQIDGRWESPDRVWFSFEGMDEMEDTSGAGRRTLQGDHLSQSSLVSAGESSSPSPHSAASESTCGPVARPGAQVEARPLSSPAWYEDPLVLPHRGKSQRLRSLIAMIPGMASRTGLDHRTGVAPLRHGPVLSHHQHRYCGVANHAVGHRSDEEPSDCAHAPNPDQNEVEAPLIRCVDDLLGGVADLE